MIWFSVKLVINMQQPWSQYRWHKTYLSPIVSNQHLLDYTIWPLICSRYATIKWIEVASCVNKDAYFMNIIWTNQRTFKTFEDILKGHSHCACLWKSSHLLLTGLCDENDWLGFLIFSNSNYIVWSSKASLLLLGPAKKNKKIKK